MNKKRLFYMDALRIFAIILVIFNHTKTRGFYRFLTDDPTTFLFWFNLFFSLVCKVAVPLFFMMSGALLLRKDESIGKTYKRGIRIIVATLVFTALFYILQNAPSGGVMSLKGYIWVLAAAPVEHLWYLYSYLALLMTVPILRGMAKGFEPKHGYLMIILAVIFAVFFPILTHWAPVRTYIVPGWIINRVSIILYYPLLGYVLNEKLDISTVTWKRLAGLWGIALLLIAIGECNEYFHLQQNPGSTLEDYLNASRFFTAPLLFVTFRKLYDRKELSENHAKALTEVGTCTYGIYLIHPVFMEYIPGLVKLWDTFETGGFLRNEFGVILTVLGTFLISLAVTFVARRIPVLKKLF